MNYKNAQITHYTIKSIKLQTEVDRLKEELIAAQTEIKFLKENESKHYDDLKKYIKNIVIAWR